MQSMVLIKKRKYGIHRVWMLSLAESFIKMETWEKLGGVLF